MLEAMLLGVPAGVLDLGGPPGRVPPGTGFVLPMTTRDDIITRLRDLLLNVQTQRQSLAETGRRAQDHVRTYYTWPAKAKQIVEVYHWLLRHLDAKPDWGTTMGASSRERSAESREPKVSR